MKLSGIWSNNLASDIENYNNDELAVKCLLSLIDESKEYDTTYYCNNDKLYNGTVNNVEFIDWIYDKLPIETYEDRRELGIYIDKAQDISESDYVSIEQGGKVNPFNGSKCYIISLCRINEKYVYDGCTYFLMKQSYLAESKTKDAFTKDMQECFKYVSFHPDVKRTLNTLNNNFNSIISEIITHLSCLSNYYPDFCMHRKNGDSNRVIGEQFKLKTGIDCSPQGSRGSVKALTKEFYNEALKRNEQLCCEMHTKFKKANRQPLKQDRIYFHPGKDGVMDGKVLVIHIGKHM